MCDFQFEKVSLYESCFEKNSILFIKAILLEHISEIILYDVLIHLDLKQFLNDGSEVEL